MAGFVDARLRIKLLGIGSSSPLAAPLLKAPLDPDSLMACDMSICCCNGGKVEGDVAASAAAAAATELCRVIGVKVKEEEEEED